MSEQAQYIRDHITGIAEAAFPDNIGNEWKILNLTETTNGFEVEVEPNPDNVGYSRFHFIIKFTAPDKPDIVKCYCLNNSGTWELLFTG
jgi:hypothetical protein